MDRISADFINEAVNDLRSVESSPERLPDDHLLKDNFKVVQELPDEQIDEKSQASLEIATQTIDENYKETVDLVKKFIRVDVPNVSATDGI